MRWNAFKRKCLLNNSNCLIIFVCLFVCLTSHQHRTVIRRRGPRSKVLFECLVERGIEPAIPGLEVQCVFHYTMGPLRLNIFKLYWITFRRFLTQFYQGSSWYTVPGFTVSQMPWVRIFHSVLLIQFWDSSARVFHTIVSAAYSARISGERGSSVTRVDSSYR